MWPLYTHGSQALGHPDQSLSSMMTDLTLFCDSQPPSVHDYTLPCRYSINEYSYRFARGHSRQSAFS